MPFDPPSMLVTIFYNTTEQQAIWNFTNWDNGYQDIFIQQITVPNAVPPQKILTGVLAGGENASILQLYYGSTSSDPESIRIEVIQPTLSPSMNVTIPPACSDQKFPITWSARQSPEYLHWFLRYVDSDGKADLIGYTSTDSNTTLTILVFPGTSTCAFDPPVVSNITFPESKGSLFTASFMAPLHTRQANFIYKHEGGTYETVGSGILSYFDNYGILGVRMVAPVTPRGSYEFEFKGQIPAVAGQISDGLGWRPQNQMGLGEPGVAIGFANCCQPPN